MFIEEHIFYVCIADIKCIKLHRFPESTSWYYVSDTAGWYETLPHSEQYSPFIKLDVL